jgi:hypothetical protein
LSEKKDKKTQKLPTKIEKALAIADVVIESHRATAKTFEVFGNCMAAAAISAAQMTAAMAQLSRIGATPTQPKEHPLVKAVREATEKED